MSGEGVWMGPNNEPLKFQDGDYVRIDVTDRPERVYSLPFLEGFVRGYNISDVEGVCSVAYELFKMGHNPLCWVQERVLIKTTEPFSHTCPQGRQCGICGANEPGQGLSIFADPAN